MHHEVVEKFSSDENQAVNMSAEIQPSNF